MSREVGGQNFDFSFMYCVVNLFLFLDVRRIVQSSEGCELSRNIAHLAEALPHAYSPVKGCTYSPPLRFMYQTVPKRGLSDGALEGATVAVT